MSETTADLVRSFVRGLRWMVPLAVGPIVALWALDVNGARDLGLPVAILLGLGIVVVFGPLIWLRFEHLGRNDKPFWAFLGLSPLWAGAWVAAIIGVLAVLGAD